MNIYDDYLNTNLYFSYESSDLTMYEGATIDYLGIDKSINKELVPLSKSFNNAIRSGNVAKAKVLAEHISMLIKDYSKAINYIDLEKASNEENIKSWLSRVFLTQIIPVLLIIAGTVAEGQMAAGILIMNPFTPTIMILIGIAMGVMACVKDLTAMKHTLDNDTSASIASHNIIRATIVKKLDDISLELIKFSKNVK